MIIMQAEAFFPVPGKDPRGPGGRVSVPAPYDPETPDVPCWYDLHAKRAPHYRSAGFTHVLLPPAGKTQSGHFPSASGYGAFDPFDLGSKDQMGSVETRFGTREQLERCVAIAHANGLRVLGDMVLHQMAGGRNGVYRYKGARTPAHPNGVPGVGRFPKDPFCFRGRVDGKTVPPFGEQDPMPSPWDDIPFGDECRYYDPDRYMWNGVKSWADWLVRSIGYDGFRMDATKALNTDFLRDLLDDPAMAALFIFGEYFDGNPHTLWKYVNQSMRRRMSTLDFTFHWACKFVCDFGHGMWRWLPTDQDNAYSVLDPLKSVLFVDSPDTDLSPGQQVIFWKRLAYARMLLLAEGVPMVYHRDYAADANCYGLQPHIDNMAWCYRHLVGGQSAVRYIDRDLIAVERLGHQVGKPGCLTMISKDPIQHRKEWCQTSFGARAHLHDYNGNKPDVWTDRNGWAEIPVPPNEFGRGNSYVCYGPVGVEDGPRPAPRPTEQTWFGEIDAGGNPDLDIAPALNGSQRVGRRWCAKGTNLGASLHLQLPPGAKQQLNMILRNKLDGVLAVIPSNVDGIPSLGGPGPQGTYEVTRDGWIEFRLESTGLPTQGVPFRLPTTYTATTELK